MRSLVNHEKSSGHSLSSRRQTHQSSPSSDLRGIHINISSDPFQHRIPPYIQRLWQESKLRRHLSLWKRRLAKRYEKLGWIEIALASVVIVGSCIVLLIHVGFFSGKKYQDWQLEHYYNDGLDEVDLLDKVYPDEGRLQTTAIVLIRDEPMYAKTIVEQLCQYDMFSTITVWNDDPAKPYTLNDILSNASYCMPNQVNVVNAPQSMGSAARYHACRLSKTPYCYFQDTPKNVLHLRSLYANFLRSPQLIHGQSADHDAFVDSQWRYCFSNTDIQLHTCYIDIESGTFVAKAMVTRFLSNNQDAVTGPFSDMYFMMFINQIPYQLEGDHGISKKQLEGQTLKHLETGLAILYEDLKEGNEQASLKPYLKSTFERNARASCQDDRCLFLTNKPILPDIQLFSYNPSLGIESSRDMHSDYIESNEDHRYMYAVDGNDQTSWKSLSNIQAGDYIGLDLLMPMRTPLRYRFLVRHPYRYRTTMAIQISYDGILWIKLHPSPHVTCQNMDLEDGTLQLLECKYVVTDTGYRYIRLESQMNHDFVFHVYDFSFSAKVKKDATGHLLDIDYDEDGIAFIEDDWMD
ncbi:hypothetical protein EDC96DRAFT_516000 [Choanephora cucurbitarum]|nr:hypothetical protein EDC96DRAFT_516000 [Choanephora cucurbitarum]